MPNIPFFTLYDIPISDFNTFGNKSFFNNKETSDEQGHYTGNYLFPTGGTKVNWQYIVDTILPHYDSLAKLNFRFNRFINPLYFLGIDGVPESPFLDYYFDPASNNKIDGKISSVNAFISNAKGGTNLQSILGYMPTDSDKSTINNYIGYFKKPQGQSIKTYVENLLPDIGNRIISFINTAEYSAFDLLNKKSDGFSNSLNKAITFFTGVDVTGIADDAIKGLEKEFLSSNDTDNPLYAASKGFAAGQITGNLFKSYLQLSKESGQDKSDFNIQKIIEANSGRNETLDVIFPDWHLPWSDPRIYNVDERLKATRRTASTDVLGQIANIKDTLLGNVNFSDFFNDIGNIDVGNTISDIGNFISSGVNDGISFAKNVINSIDNVNVDTIQNFLQANLPKAKQDGDIWDNVIDLFLSDPSTARKYAPLLAVESHKQYVKNNPSGVYAKWWVVDNDSLFENNGQFFSNFINDSYEKGTLGYPNIKTKLFEVIRDKKVSSQKDNSLIFEGVQQFDGSFESIEYENFDPKNVRADINNAEVLSHVSNQTIVKLVDNINVGEKRNYSKDIESGWQKELQYFPFYFKTISRDDYAVVQQPYYDNNSVFMSKKKITANSIVFLEAVIKDINEGFQSNISKENYLGRTESVLSYNGTNRTFAITFELVATSPKDIPSIRQKVLTLVQMMYPQVMAINDIGVIGYRRGPMVEMRVGDMYLLQGMIASMQLNWGGDAKIWETIPGGRTLKGCAITLNLEVIHYEQPHAGYDFWSPTFNPKVFYPNWNDKSNSLAQTTNEQNQNNKSIFEKVSETIDGITNNIPSELTGVINF